MNNYQLQYTALNHQAYHLLLRAFGRDEIVADDERDRGAVSLEQVLWFVVVGASAAAIGYFLFDRIWGIAQEPIDINDGFNNNAP